MEDRTGRLVVAAQHAERSIVENDDMVSDTEAESNMSLRSRSFLHRVNDQVRKRQYQSSKDATEDSDKHCDIENVYVFHITSICIHGKKYLENLFHQKY